MYETQTESVIKQRMLDRITSTIDKLEGSLTNDAISPIAVELTQMYIELDRILELVFAQTSSGDYLEYRAAEFGVSRKQGTNAIGKVTFTGVNDTVIPLGTQARTVENLVFATTIEGTIESGIANVPIEASTIGTTYNIPSATIINLPVSILGVTAVTNADPTSGGTNVETDAELLTRLLVKVQTPTTSGNSNEYKLWALEVDGVGDAKIFPLWNGNGTVKVLLVDSNKTPANATIVDNVATYVESVRPIGATLTVLAATGLNINISVSVTKDSAYTLQQVTDNITAKLTAYLKSIAFKSNYVSYAQMGNAIIDSEGVIDYSSLTINGGTANISVKSEEVAILGAVTIT